MDKIICISPQITGGISALGELGNSDTFLSHLQPVDYHFALFSTLYQSGVDTIQLEPATLPEAIRQHPFWRDRIAALDKKDWTISAGKANSVLENNFDLAMDEKFRAPQYWNINDQLTRLFYSAKTGIPYVNAEFPAFRNFKVLESRLSKELYLAIGNLYSVIKCDKLDTVSPSYSVLRKDVRRFEDIINSALYKRYSESMSLLTESKSDLLRKDIRVRSLKLYYKFGKQLEAKETLIGFLKFNKRVLDLFMNKFTSLLGDYLIEMLQTVVSKNPSVRFYNIREAHYMIQWAERIGELMLKGGKTKLGDFLLEIGRNPSNPNLPLPPTENYAS